MSSLKKSRIETLDWLRGLMAIAIMLYHLTYWIIFPIDASNPLGRLGIYGVSIFFVLSGLSMSIVYNTYFKTVRTFFVFFARRLFRIWPLFWVVSFLAILPQIIKTGVFSWKFFIINSTTLFGFIDPTAYIPTGAWSIGNEMVYYVLTPFIFLLFNYKKWLGNVFFAFTTGVGLYFAFALLDPYLTLTEQWAIYVNPFNNFFLYVMGIFIYYNFKDINIKPKFNLLLLLSAVLFFSLLPFEGDSMIIVSGVGRIVFVVISFFIVLSFYKLEITLPTFLNTTLETFGIATYGVYLIHPIVYSYLKVLLEKLNIYSSFSIFTSTVLLTIVFSILSYNLFEKRLIIIGKKLTSSKAE